MGLTPQLIGTSRHLSQHLGGFVLIHDRLDELVLALGMLSCMKRAFDPLANHKGIALDLATIPVEDPNTCAMIRKADTLVF
jgi:error-prone DNA polymerase